MEEMWAVGKAVALPDELNQDFPRQPPSSHATPLGEGEDAGMQAQMHCFLQGSSAQSTAGSRLLGVPRRSQVAVGRAVHLAAAAGRDTTAQRGGQVSETFRSSELPSPRRHPLLQLLEPVEDDVVGRE